MIPDPYFSNFFTFHAPIIPFRMAQTILQRLRHPIIARETQIIFKDPHF